jgi:hypothetical protein
MPDYIVHTQKRNPEVHFFYRVTSSDKDLAFDRLVLAGAVVRGEEHVETFSMVNEGFAHELLAVFKL